MHCKPSNYLKDQKEKKYMRQTNLDASRIEDEKIPKR